MQNPSMQIDVWKDTYPVYNHGLQEKSCQYILGLFLVVFER